MLAANGDYGRSDCLASTPTTAISAGLSRPKFPFRNYSKFRTSKTLSTDPANSRMKRLKAKKVNSAQKIDPNKKKSIEYTEMTYREAVSKLKYLLAESYGPRTMVGKSHGIRSTYQCSNPRINESGEDTDDRSIISDGSRTKDLGGNVFTDSYFPPSKGIHPSKAYSNLALSAADLQSIPPELTSFIERQEEYIGQLERESQYCRDELTNLLRKVREVVAENEALHNKTKTGFLKCALEEHKNYNEENNECKKESHAQTENFEPKTHKILEGPSIVFESRISELEAQLTQAKLELRKAQEDSRESLKRLSESCMTSGNPELKIQLEQALRGKYDAEAKLEDLQKSLSHARDKEAEALQKAKRSADAMQQMEFEKSQCEAEVRRLKDELDRQHEKLREATQEASRRIAEERQQAERRYSQQVEQLSADIASHWDAANKSQLESEKQRRELTDLRRELSQKQTFIDNLKKELHNKMSSLQSELIQANAEKDAADQEILSTKLATERSERQARQEKSRLEAEINSYKQRLERTDADLVHCRRENLRLLEQIASLEKEINMNKTVQPEENRGQISSRLESEKDLTSMIMDMETKHEGLTDRDTTTVGKTASTSNKKRTVKILNVKENSVHQTVRFLREEMASLQSDIEYLSNKIQDTFHTQKVGNKNESSLMHDSDIPTNSFKQTDERMTEEQKFSIPHQQDYNNTHPMETEKTAEYSNAFQENSNIDGYDNAQRELDMSASIPQEYEETNADPNNEQKHTEGDNTEPYGEQYNQYEQYPISYEEQEYVNDNHSYNVAEAHNENQLSIAETPQVAPDTNNHNTEYTH